jgi:hypothetical protein
LAVLGITVAPSTVWEILKTHGVEPAPERDRQTWAAFLRGQAHAILAADFFETRTLTGARLYIFAVMSMPPATSVPSAGPRTPPRSGPRNWPGIWSWTSKTPAPP